MALTITISQLSQAVRETVTGSAPPPVLGILTRELAVADALIEDYVNLPGCPDEVKNEAAIRIVGYLFKEEFSKSNTNVSTPVDVFRNSHAKSLLRKWHAPVYAVVR